MYNDTADIAFILMPKLTYRYIKTCVSISIVRSDRDVEAFVRK